MQKQLGNNNIAMTLDLYSHVSMGKQRDAIERQDKQVDLDRGVRRKLRMVIVGRIDLY